MSLDDEPGDLAAAPNVLGYQILFAMHPGGRPTAALLRAVAMSLRMSARLTVLVVASPRPTLIAPVFPKLAARELEAGLTLDDVMARTRLWVLEFVPQARIIEREGSFTQAVVDASIEHEIDLVVVSDEDLGAPKDLLFVVHEAGVPSLLARPPEASPTVVVATDLRNPEAPVLRAGSSFGAQFNAPVVAVHNVVTAPGAVPTTLAVGATEQEHTQKTETLSRAVAELDGSVEAMIVSEPRTADAVLHAARERDADLMVIGAYDGSWMERALFGGTAEQILQESRRSVLVLPLRRRRPRGEPSAPR